MTAGDYKGLGKTVVDDSTIGDKIMVSEIKLVPVPQALQSKYFRLKGDHFVVAKVTLTPGGKVGTGYTDMIKLFDGPEDTIGNYALDATSLPDDVAALTAAGYPLVTIDGKSSAPVSGYIAFLHDDSKSGPLRIVLHRQAATLTDFGLGGGGETTEQVSAKDFPVIN